MNIPNATSQFFYIRRLAGSINARSYMWKNSRKYKREKKYDKFILVATEGAIASKWCNWELGFGDAQKYAYGKIALFPIRDDEKDWSGSEYLELYPVIGYIDSCQYSDEFNQSLFTGYYVFCHYGTKKAIKLVDWLSR